MKTLLFVLLLGSLIEWTQFPALADLPIEITSRVELKDTLIIGSGRDVVGKGPVGTDDRGPIYAFGKFDGIKFTGVGTTPFTGTGGSLQNLKVRAIKPDSGDAVTITAEGPNNRTGEMLLHRLLIYGDGSGSRGLARRGLFVDGSMLTTLGSAGIRRVTISDVRVADTREESIYLWNAVHCSIVNTQIDTGLGVAPVMRVRDGQNVVGTNLIINGTLKVEGSAVDMMFSGRFDEVQIGKTCRNIVILGPVRKLTVESGATGSLYGTVQIVDNKSKLFVVGGGIKTVLQPGK
jgi:hypothetical protein